jgi:uncharacterized protein YbgA (DUF1722 family)
VVILSKYELHDMLSLIEKYRVTYLPLVPPILVALVFFLVVSSWTKHYCLNEGIFVHLCLKKSCARHVGAFPFHQTEQLDGRG